MRKTINRKRGVRSEPTRHGVRGLTSPRSSVEHRMSVQRTPAIKKASTATRKRSVATRTRSKK